MMVTIPDREPITSLLSCTANVLACRSSGKNMTMEPDRDTQRPLIFKAPSGPSGESATDLAQSGWPSIVCCNEPVAASQTRTVRSLDPEAMSRPSGENATDLVEPDWPFRGR